MQSNARKRLFQFHKFDLIVIVGALCLVAALTALFARIMHTPGNKVEVVSHNKTIGTYDLGTDGEYEFSDLFGSNRLIIKDGSAYVTEGSCSRHICEKMGPISDIGEMIICLPNELFVKVVE